MASADLQAFVESRLLALDPSMDVSSGSPAQTKFVQPLLTYLGTDPFETDLDAFLIDRAQQEFPDIYASDPGALRDAFINPLRVFLEPFKRAVNGVKRAQSLIDPTLLSDEEADALVANVFAERDPGGFASGTARLFFSNPTNFTIDVANRILSKGGLSFYPSVPTSITAEAMVFNRDGTRFFFDVDVRAEKEGDEYNIASDQLVSVEGVSNVLSVTNISRFSGGAPREDTPTFVGNAERSLTEQSLNTDRGAEAAIKKNFKGQVRAVQVIGAKDPEMQRDILSATAPGHSWLAGDVLIYGKVAYVRCRIVDGEETDTPQPGDTLFVYLSRTQFPDLPQNQRFVRLKVEQLLIGPRTDGGEYQVAYFVRWSGTFPVAVSLPNEFEGGFSKKGNVTIDSVPGALSKLVVKNQAVHVFGHTDIYVRPVLQDVSTSVLDSISDAGRIGSLPTAPHFYLERTTLLTSSGSNAVTDSWIDALGITRTLNFEQAGVLSGMSLVIESGPDSGVYRVVRVSGTQLLLNKKLTTTFKDARYRVLKDLRVPLFEPRIVRFPFGDAANDDCATTIGSDLLQFSKNDLISYGAKVGDVVRLKSGLDVGDYTIESFDNTLGGRGAVVDRKLSSTNSGIQYEVFTPLNQVEKPLVRLREIAVLDSAKQVTGLTVPPADPVAVTPAGVFSSASVLGKSKMASGYVLPDLSWLLPSALEKGLTSQASTPPDRFSQGIDQPDGIYIPVVFPDGTQAELDLRTDSIGKCSYFMATCESFDTAESKPPVDPKSGECLSLKSGPNAGDYLIRQVQKFRYKPALGKTAWVYFIQIYEEFPVDPIGLIIASVLTQSIDIFDVDTPITFPIAFPGWFEIWYSLLGDKVYRALQVTGLASPPTADDLQKMTETLCATSYEWGLPARGTLRTYFREPTVLQQNTADGVVTRFVYTAPTGAQIVYRPDPSRYQKHQIFPPRVTSDLDPASFPRDITFSTASTPAFADTSRPTIFNSGVAQHDVLAVHREVDLLPATPGVQAVVKTTAGSNLILLPDGPSALFLPSMVGNLFFIEEGADAGGYRITSVAADGRSAVLDRALTSSTERSVREGSVETWETAGGNTVRATGSVGTFSLSFIGQFITVYGVDYRIMGSYVVTAVALDGSTCDFDAGAAASYFPGSSSVMYWLVSPQPSSPPAQMVREQGTPYVGTELLGARPVRCYEAVAEEFDILDVTPDPDVSSCVLDADAPTGHFQPYRILRRNVRRITSAEMEANRDGFLYYFDTEVLSLSPSPLANISDGLYLTMVKGTYESVGYRHVVLDRTRSYSMEEDGFVDLPLSVLPAGSEDSPESFVSIIGVPAQLSYERAELVKQVQGFVDSKQDRVSSANMLVRHFLPAVVSYDATFVGGSSADRIGKDIVDFINQTPAGSAIDVSEIQKKIEQRGGNPRTPTKVSVTVYDWDRSAWVEFSEDELGGDSLNVPFNGSARVAYFMAGKNSPATEAEPNGERVRLTRR